MQLLIPLKYIISGLHDADRIFQPKIFDIFFLITPKTTYAVGTH